MSNSYYRKSEQVVAVQFRVNEKPWPLGIVDGKDLPIPVKEGTKIYGMPHMGSYLIVEDGEWIVTYRIDDRKEAYTDEEFKEKFVSSDDRGIEESDIIKDEDMVVRGPMSEVGSECGTEGCHGIGCHFAVFSDIDNMMLCDECRKQYLEEHKEQVAQDVEEDTNGS